MDRKALSPVLLLMASMAIAGCPKPGPTPLPKGQPPEYETPRAYDPDKNIDGTPMVPSSASPNAPAPSEAAPPPPAPPSGDTPPADKPPADKPPADKPPADKPPADKPPADKPPADAAPAPEKKK